MKNMKMLRIGVAGCGEVTQIMHLPSLAQLPEKFVVTALITMFGPVRRVTGSARITSTQRTIRSEPKMGTKINVETPTHIASILDFACGPTALPEGLPGGRLEK
jgi:hypothetical protein